MRMFVCLYNESPMLFKKKKKAPTRKTANSTLCTFLVIQIYIHIYTNTPLTGNENQKPHTENVTHTQNKTYHCVYVLCVQLSQPNGTHEQPIRSSLIFFCFAMHA